MSQPLALELSDAAYAALRRQAETVGIPPESLAAAALERQFGPGPRAEAPTAQARRDRFERHFGAIDLGAPTGADNASIDADLARAYDPAPEDP